MVLWLLWMSPREPCLLSPCRQQRAQKGLSHIPEQKHPFVAVQSWHLWLPSLSAKVCRSSGSHGYLTQMNSGDPCLGVRSLRMMHDGSPGWFRSHLSEESCLHVAQALCFPRQLGQAEPPLHSTLPGILQDQAVVSVCSPAGSLIVSLQSNWNIPIVWINSSYYVYALAFLSCFLKGRQSF